MDLLPEEIRLLIDVCTTYLKPIVITALNTGMIDTVYAPPLGALALQWHAGMNYMTGLPLAHSTGSILVSSKYFKKLPEDMAKLLTTNFEKSMRELTLTLRNQSREAIELIQDSGLTIGPVPSQEILEEFYAIHNQVAKNLTGKLFPGEVLERVYVILKRPK